MSDYNSSLTAEQIENRLVYGIVANETMDLTETQKAQARYNIGAGTSSSGLQIRGYFDTYDELKAAITKPAPGETYAVGTEAPYSIHIWDVLHNLWIDNGYIRGADGTDANVTAENIVKALGYTPADKANLLQFTNTNVAKTAFVSDATYVDYPFRAAVALSGVLATMTPEVIFGCADAAGGNFAPVAECYNGGVYIYASSVPDAATVIPTIICLKAVE